MLVAGWCITACEKDDGVDPFSTINVEVRHHTWGIANASVWFKSGTDTFPGKDGAAYDQMQITDENGNTTFRALRGNHYLMVMGFDPLVNDSVVGYGPVVVDETTVDADQQLTATLYVSHY
ncbi:MAG: hypothetical protein AAGB22_12870 [Bacteroidota bacterium]